MIVINKIGKKNVKTCFFGVLVVVVVDNALNVLTEPSIWTTNKI